jgi:hypothetical protein
MEEARIARCMTGLNPPHVYWDAENRIRAQAKSDLAWQGCTGTVLPESVLRTSPTGPVLPGEVREDSERQLREARAPGQGGRFSSALPLPTYLSDVGMLEKRSLHAILES